MRAQVRLHSAATGVLQRAAAATGCQGGRVGTAAMTQHC